MADHDSSLEVDTIWLFGKNSINSSISTTIKNSINNPNSTNSTKSTNIVHQIKIVHILQIVLIEIQLQYRILT